MTGRSLIDAIIIAAAVLRSIWLGQRGRWDEGTYTVALAILISIQGGK